MEWNLNSNNRKIWEIHNYVEIKQQTPKLPMSKKEITRKIRKYFDINKDENTTYLNLQDEAKARLRWKLIATNI